MKKAFLPALGLALALLVAGCRDSELIRGMARFDRAYVPALMLTASDDRTGQAVMAVKNLKFEWNILKSRAISRRGGWGGTMDKVEDRINEADGLINAGDNRGAHAALEDVRDAMLRQRREAGMEYFPDYLVEFQEVMEKVVHSVEAEAALTGAGKKRIRRDLHRATHRWKKVRNAEFHGDIFGFDAEKSKKFKGLMEDEQRALDALGDAFLNDDTAEIREAARGLKPPFEAVFRLFGDFDHLL